MPYDSDDEEFTFPTVAGFGTYGDTCFQSQQCGQKITGTGLHLPTSGDGRNNGGAVE